MIDDTTADQRRTEAAFWRARALAERDKLLVALEKLAAIGVLVNRRGCECGGVQPPRCWPCVVSDILDGGGS